MATIIAIKDNPNHSILQELDGVIYRLEFLFNVSAEFWTMSIYDEDDNIILRGIKIVPNYPLTFYHKNKKLPTGDFLCETSDVNARIVRNSFSKGKAKLLYLTKEELEAL